MASPDGAPLVVVYHADCIDGAACAWGVAKAHGIDKQKDANVTYIPYAHHDVEKAQEQIRAALAGNANVYFVDVAPTPKFLDELMTPDKDGKAKAATIRVMDHHESAAKDLKGYTPPVVTGEQPKLEIQIEERRMSAALMVWQKMMPDEPVPAVLGMIDKMDGDARGLLTPHDFAAASMIDTRDISTPWKAFSALRGLAAITFNEMAQRGRPMVRDQDRRIKRVLENSYIVPLPLIEGQPPQKVLLVNADVKQFGRHISARLIEAAKAQGADVSFAWFLQKNGTVTASIRTDGDPDASEIAANLRKTMAVTGGGHDGAGAIHFPSLFDFARHIQAAQTLASGVTAANDPVNPAAKKYSPPPSIH
ncbi:MAG: DHHA1 domain-containing protein [bacterium]|nr:DHHA1 domain-containing protein [bacterium]